MTEDDVRRIVREEISKAGPVIVARAVAAQRRGHMGYRRFAMQPDGSLEDVTFQPS